MIKNFLLLLFLSSIAFGDVVYSPLYNHTKQEKEMVGIAQELSNDLLNSSCFEKFMLDRKLIQTNGLTRKQVVDDLKSKDLAVPVHMYHKMASKVVGYREPPLPDVYTNRKFHNGSTACARGSNLLHEWSHTAGYGHDFKATRRRPRSVPYSINAAFKVCCACDGIKDCEILDEPVKPKTKVFCRRTWYTLWIVRKCYTMTL